MNRVTLSGRLTADPETRHGTITVGTFNLAVDRKCKKDGEATADFFKCTSFGKQADFVSKYLHKGIKIIVVGRIENDNYTKKDGTKVYGVQIITEEIEFCESKGKGDKPKEDSDGFMNIPDGIDEELPFI